MTCAEIELKFPIADLDALQSRLPGLGFHLDTPRTFEHNTLYDTPTRDLRTRRQILRLRQYGSLCTVTHKRHPEHEDPIEMQRYKVRIETETTITDGEALAEIFQQLGYAPAFIYDKYRSEWSQPLPETPELRAHLVIDETPIGNYAELEGPAKWIDHTLEALNVQPSECLTESYGKLFLTWKMRTGDPAEHLTFDAVDSLQLTGR